jgi:hypothetical protein
MCAGGNGFSVLKFDPALDPAAPGGIENPTLLYSRQIPGVSIAHSGSFSYDGKVLIFGHEPGGGTGAQCQAKESGSIYCVLFWQQFDNCLPACSGHLPFFYLRGLYFRTQQDR